MIILPVFAADEQTLKWGLNKKNIRFVTVCISIFPMFFAPLRDTYNKNNVTLNPQFLNKQFVLNRKHVSETWETTIASFSGLVNRNSKETNVWL